MEEAEHTTSGRMQAHPPAMPKGISPLCLAGLQGDPDEVEKILSARDAPKIDEPDEVGACARSA